MLPTRCYIYNEEMENFKSILGNTSKALGLFLCDLVFFGKKLKSSHSLEPYIFIPPFFFQNSATFMLKKIEIEFFQFNDVTYPYQSKMCDILISDIQEVLSVCDCTTIQAVHVSTECIKFKKSILMKYY